MTVEVALRKQHYIQACAHLSILTYWGWYWHEVYDAAPLIAAQLMFAYAFDALLAWSRRDVYTFGFGPFPIIFSTNLFLWFKADWFYLQFLLVAVGFTAKELIRWNKDGRRVHIFNPSSFTLAIFSLGLLVTGRTHISWGPEIAATQFNPPHIYLLIFLVALPGQFLFGVASMTLSAVATIYAFCLTYYFATGSHFFLELPFPIAIFLAMHLLFTDPSTSPRTELGRIMFGVLYASSVVALYVVLDRLGLPTFYDKLLSVPLLNLSIQAIDRAARSNLLKRFDPGALGRSLAPKRRNLAYMTLWVALFVTMQAQTGAEATLARADSLKDQGRMEEALTRYREFVEGHPNDFEGQRRLGGALLEAGPRCRRSAVAPPRRRTAAAQRGRALQPWLRPVAAGRVRRGAGPFQAGARHRCQLRDGAVRPWPGAVGRRTARRSGPHVSRRRQPVAGERRSALQPRRRARAKRRSRRRGHVVHEVHRARSVVCRCEPCARPDPRETGRTGAGDRSVPAGASLEA